METTNKQFDLYHSFSNYQRLSDDEKVAFWKHRKSFVDTLETKEKTEHERAVWANIDQIKERLKTIGQKLEKAMPEEV